jgi:D-methionine transport system ATP-binding protein
VINRLTTASSGKISFKNREYPQIPVISLRKQIALVSPESKLLGMTVGEALAYPLILRGLAPQMIQERVTYWREQLEIPEQWLTKTEVQLSGGERQLVAIARSLVIQPEILLLDEPTTCLDPGRAAHLMQILIQLSQTQSTAILMINHQLDLVQEFCTGLLYLHQGTLLLNQATSNIDWVTLKVNLLKKATQAEAEWI